MSSTSRSNDDYCSQDGLNEVESKPKSVGLPGLLLPPINCAATRRTINASPRTLYDLSPSLSEPTKNRRHADRNVANRWTPWAQHPTSKDCAGDRGDDRSYGFLTKSDTNLYELVAQPTTTPTKKQREREVVKSRGDADGGIDDRLLRLSSVDLGDSYTTTANCPTSREQLDETVSIGGGVDGTNRKEKRQGVRLPRIDEPGDNKRTHRRHRSIEKSFGSVPDPTGTAFDEWS